jgi:hypothetical protein
VIVDLGKGELTGFNTYVSGQTLKELPVRARHHQVIAGLLIGNFTKHPSKELWDKNKWVMTEKLTLVTKSKFEQGRFTHHWHILNTVDYLIMHTVRTALKSMQY